MTFNVTAYVAFGSLLESLRVERAQQSFSRAFNGMQLLIYECLVEPLYNERHKLSSDLLSWFLDKDLQFHGNFGINLCI